MAKKTGRACSPVRTPLLIRNYLAGVDAYPGDQAGDGAIRASDGDYISRTHHRVKAEIKRLDPGYQYPRQQSFLSLINNLIVLGLVERTGEREDPLERGAGQVGTAGGFEQRTFIRLTPGSLARGEWADPMGHVGLIYKTPRGPDWLPADAPPIPTSPRERGRPRVTAGLSQGTVDGLNRRRLALIQAAHDSQDSNDLADFRELADDASAFLNDVNAAFPTRTQFPNTVEALALLRNCIQVFERAGGSGGQLVIAASNCQASSRLLAESIGTPLVGASMAAPTPIEPSERPPVPSINLPDQFTLATVPRLTEHLDNLDTLARASDWPEADYPELSAEVARLIAIGEEWAVTAQDALSNEDGKGSPSQVRLENLEARVGQLESYVENLQDEDLTGAIGALEEVERI